MKKEIGKAMNLMSEHKSTANMALIRVETLKRENQNLKALLSRYRKILSTNLKNNKISDST